jgi:hypothetical protein
MKSRINYFPRTKVAEQVTSEPEKRFLFALTMLLMRIAFSIAIVALLTSCAHQPVTRIHADRALTDEEALVAAKARQAIRARHVQIEIPRESSAGAWTVVAWPLPAAPCRFLVVTVFANGGTAVSSGTSCQTF